MDKPFPKLRIKSDSPSGWATRVWIDDFEISNCLRDLRLEIGVDSAIHLHVDMLVGALEVETPLGAFSLNGTLPAQLDSEAFESVVVKAVENAERRGRRAQPPPPPSRPDPGQPLKWPSK